jgi:hypothetical protein
MDIITIKEQKSENNGYTSAFDFLFYNYTRTEAKSV